MDTSGITDHKINKPMRQRGIILQQDADDREAWTNVPHTAIHHSPSGYGWGYSGSGAADLALNILEAVLRREHYHGHRVKCWRGSCYDRAWHLHQDYKRAVIAGIPEAGTVIPYQSVVDWLAAQPAEDEAQA